MHHKMLVIVSDYNAQELNPWPIAEEMLAPYSEYALGFEEINHDGLYDFHTLISADRKREWIGTSWHITAVLSVEDGLEYCDGDLNKSARMSNLSDNDWIILVDYHT